MPDGFGFNPALSRAMACPTCGYVPVGGPMIGGPWMGGPMTWGGTFPGMYSGPGWAYPNVPSDDQVREMIYDAIDADPVIPYDSDIKVDVTAGVVTLIGTVPNKRVKHAAGDDAWWVPGVWDVNNSLQAAGRHKVAGAPGPRATTRPTARETRKRT